MNVLAILGVAAEVLAAAKAAINLGQDAAPLLADLKRLFSGESISEAELAEIRARSDAVNAEIENIKE